MRVLALLLGAALVLGLALFAVDKVNEPGPSPAERSGLDVGAAPAPVSEAGRIAECDQAARDIRGAEEAYRTLYSRYADLPTLVQAGNLTQVTAFYTVESTDGWATYRLVGQGGCP